MSNRMYVRFSDRARKVMQLSTAEARRFHHESVDTTHLLLGILKEGHGAAACVLKNRGVDVRAARIAVGDLVPCDDRASEDFGKLPESPGLRKVLEHAFDQAQSLNHHYVGTEHLLLGALREPDNLVARILATFGVEPADIRKDVLDLLGHE